jgi:hypothetical protein
VDIEMESTNSLSGSTRFTGSTHQTASPIENLLPTFSAILGRLDVQIARGNRCPCPIHGGHNPTSFCWDERKGVFYCHSCHAGGDKIALVMLALGMTFKEALAWLEITYQPGGPGLKPDLQSVRRRRLKHGLELESRRIGRRLRDEFYRRNRIIGYASERLSVNPDDELGWRLLEIGYKGIALDELERLLDLIDIGSHEDKLAAWRALRRAEKSQ